jgi:hypothetical protein
MLSPDATDASRNNIKRKQEQYETHYDYEPRVPRGGADCGERPAAVKQQYLDKLSPILNGKTDVIGFVYVINGEINSAEVYNNKNLFRALWAKLLDAAVTEAITEHRTDHDFQPMQASDLRAFFETSLSGSATERRISKTTRLKTYTTPTTVLFETQDMEADGAWIHKSFINKGNETVTVPLDRDSRQYRQQTVR